jgi:hypothetical protein
VDHRDSRFALAGPSNHVRVKGLASTAVARMLAQVGALLVMSACGPQPQPVPSGSAATSAVPLGATVVASAAVGYLEGRASIGPLQPVERIGVPLPTPSAAACTARCLIVFDAQTGAEATRFDLAFDCTYRFALSPGTYRVELQRRGIDSSKDLP